jgi:antitoxin (DNA-binding transcriptional repressor) of toxin-antitoxin stability system
MLEIELTQAQADLPKLIEAISQGEKVIITKSSYPVAQLVLPPRREGRLEFGSAAGLITFSDDFDEPLEDFAEYS